MQETPTARAPPAAGVQKAAAADVVNQSAKDDPQVTAVCAALTPGATLTAHQLHWPHSQQAGFVHAVCSVTVPSTAWAVLQALADASRAQAALVQHQQQQQPSSTVSQLAAGAHSRGNDAQ